MDDAALGIATEILPFRSFAEGKIEVESPALYTSALPSLWEGRAEV